MAKKTIKQLKNLTIYDDDGRKSFKLSGVVLAYPTVIEPKVSRSGQPAEVFCGRAVAERNAG